MLEYLEAAARREAHRPEGAESRARAFEARAFQLGQAIGEVAEDLLVAAKDLFPPSAQISELFPLGDYSRSTADRQVGCWLRAGIGKVILTLVTAKAADRARL